MTNSLIDTTYVVVNKVAHRLGRDGIVFVPPCFRRRKSYNFRHPHFIARTIAAGQLTACEICMEDWTATKVKAILGQPDRE